MSRDLQLEMVNGKLTMTRKRPCVRLGRRSWTRTSLPGSRATFLSPGNLEEETRAPRNIPAQKLRTAHYNDRLTYLNSPAPRSITAINRKRKLKIGCEYIITVKGGAGSRLRGRTTRNRILETQILNGDHLGCPPRNPVPQATASKK